MRITHLSSKSATNDDEIVNYLNIISSKVAEKIESKFLSTEERKQAEISLQVCTLLLEEHLKERKRYGHSPTS